MPSRASSLRGGCDAACALLGEGASRLYKPPPAHTRARERSNQRKHRLKVLGFTKGEAAAKAEDEGLLAWTKLRGERPSRREGVGPQYPWWVNAMHLQQESEVFNAPAGDRRNLFTVLRGCLLYTSPSPRDS